MMNDVTARNGDPVTPGYWWAIGGWTGSHAGLPGNKKIVGVGQYGEYLTVREIGIAPALDATYYEFVRRVES